MKSPGQMTQDEYLEATWMERREGVDYMWRFTQEQRDLMKELYLLKAIIAGEIEEEKGGKQC